LLSLPILARNSAHRNIAASFAVKAKAPPCTETTTHYVNGPALAGLHPAATGVCDSRALAGGVFVFILLKGRKEY
jgi:hypothetical protein